MIINNKQVNIWRGDQEPPTIYHVWIWKDLEIRINNGTGSEGWITLINNAKIVEELVAVIDKVNQLEIDFNNFTINNKYIKDNPILDGNDIEATIGGHFYKENDNIANVLNELDKLLKTEIIE